MKFRHVDELLNMMPSITHDDRFLDVLYDEEGGKPEDMCVVLDREEAKVVDKTRLESIKNRNCSASYGAEQLHRIKDVRSILLSFVWAVVFFAMCVTAIPLRVEAADSSNVGKVTGATTMFSLPFSWEYPYSDDFFLRSCDQYDHDLARLSLGVAVAASRYKGDAEYQEHDLVDLWEKMGFTEFDTELYQTDPTPTSICYGFAQKQVGDATVVSVAVCGGNYGKEWASNLTVGEGTRAEGFQAASEKVEEAIDAYLKEHSTNGAIKLWITGYSRGAAVANITAADCTESDAYEDVYCYTFATPRTTKDPIPYPNIFNIIQKEDPVPRIPLWDWGYERFGIDLFLVSPLSDEDCLDVMEKTAANYRMMVGREMVRNTEIDSEVRTLLDYFLMFMPNSSVYAENIQPLAVEIFSEDEEGAKDALYVLLETLQRYERTHKGSNAELKQMLDYLITLIEVQHFRRSDDVLPPGQWDPELGGKNLFHTHMAFEYVSKMFASDDPGELFSDNLDYILLIIYGNADITILDGDDVLKQVLSDGTELVDGAASTFSYPNTSWSEGKVTITLPANRSFTVKVESRSSLPQTITYTGYRASARTVRAEADNVYSLLMNDRETAIIRTSDNGSVIEPDSSDYMNISVMVGPLYSPTNAMRLENNQIMNVTISGFANRILLLAIIMIVQLILSIILLFFRKKRDRKRNKIVAFIWHACCVGVFAILEGAMWYLFPNLPWIRMIPGLLAFAVIVLYALKGCFSESHRWKSFWIFIFIMAACMTLQGMLFGDYTTRKAMLLILYYMAGMIIACIVLWNRTIVFFTK